MLCFWYDVSATTTTTRAGVGLMSEWLLAKGELDWGIANVQELGVEFNIPEIALV